MFLTIAMTIMPLTFFIGLMEGAASIVLQKMGRGFQFDWRYVPLVVADIFTSYAIFNFFGLEYRYSLITILAPISRPMIGMESWVDWATLFVIADFLFYWMHRAAHMIPIWWAHHSVHHTPNRLNLVTANVNGISSAFSGLTLFFSPLVFWGYPPAAVVKVVLFIVAYQTFVHSEWFPRLGFLERVFVTPSNHRVHHAVNPEFLNSNFGGVLVVYDHIFATFKIEPDNPDLRYGLIEPERGYNFIKIALQGYIRLIINVFNAPNPLEAMRRLFWPMS